MTNRMDNIRQLPVIDMGEAIDQMFEGAMKLLEATRRTMEDHPTTAHKQYAYQESFRAKEVYTEMTDEEKARLHQAFEEADRLFPENVTGTGGDDTWFDYHPADLSAIKSIIDLTLRVVGTDEWAGPPTPEETQPMIKPLLQDWVKTADINDPASQTGELVPYLYNWLAQYEVDTTDCGSLDPAEFAEDQELDSED